MLESTNKGISFLKGFNFKKFCDDEKTQYALVRAIEIIGEASKKIPNHIKDTYTDIPWREISGMRDKLIHDYFGVNKQVLWETAKKDLPILKNMLKSLLKNINNSNR
jgi:uncharacterized protein with HEPN domain